MLRWYLVQQVQEQMQLFFDPVFIVVGTEKKHRVVRASMPLNDRSKLKVGPISIEILDPLKCLRVRCEPNEWGIEMDVTWTASHHPLEEPRQYLRREGKVVFEDSEIINLQFVGEPDKLDKIVKDLDKKEPLEIVRSGSSGISSNSKTLTI